MTTDTDTQLNTHTDTADVPQPFASVIDLIHRYDLDAIIDALTDHARFEADDEEVDLYHRLLAGRRYLELEQLTERMIHYEEMIDNLILPEAEVIEEVQA